MSYPDMPTQSRVCDDCRQTTYEDEFYACDCEADTECDECGESKEGGPYKNCNQHYHKDIPEVQAGIFDALLAERNKLELQLKNARIEIASLKIIINDMHKAVTDTLDKVGAK